MEDFLDGPLRLLFRALGYLVRGLIWLVWEGCVEIVAWYVGWPVCRALSWGRYPSRPIHDYDNAGFAETFWVSSVGLITLVVLGWMLAVLAGY